MNVVAKKNWVYCIYQSDSDYIVSIPFGHGSIDFSRAFRIDLDSLEDDYLSNLAKRISENYDQYRQYEVTHP